MNKIRPAKRSDKQEILSFCTNTFSWGDYIDRVWDYWFKSGQLFVVQAKGGKKIGMSHVTICPDTKSMWLEGLRVHPDHRRSKIATGLLAKMIRYGRRKGAVQASAIVDVGNLASQRMMEKNGFIAVSRWAYHSAGSLPKMSRPGARLATVVDFDELWGYLQHSKIFRLSARRYVKSWHWYTLEQKALLHLIRDGSVVVTGRPVNGIAIMNKLGYWDRANMLQIVYLDAKAARPLNNLVSYLANIYLDGKFEEFQVICYDSERMTSFIEKFMTKDQEHFLLYDKVFRAKASSSR